jgi:hypothetical protein
MQFRSLGLGNDLLFILSRRAENYAEWKLFKLVYFICCIDSLGALGAPASRRLGLAMAAVKTKQPNGAAPDLRKSICIRKYEPARRRRSQGAQRIDTANKNRYIFSLSLRMPGRATSDTMSPTYLASPLQGSVLSKTVTQGFRFAPPPATHNSPLRGSCRINRICLAASQLAVNGAFYAPM